MKKIALFAYGNVYYGNEKIFDYDWMKNFPLGNSWGFYFCELKERMARRGWSLSAPDPETDSLLGFQKILFFDMPDKKRPCFKDILNGPHQKYL